MEGAGDAAAVTTSMMTADRWVLRQRIDEARDVLMDPKPKPNPTPNPNPNPNPNPDPSANPSPSPSPGPNPNQARDVLTELRVHASSAAVMTPPSNPSSSPSPNPGPYPNPSPNPSPSPDPSPDPNPNPNPNPNQVMTPPGQQRRLALLATLFDKVQ